MQGQHLQGHLVVALGGERSARAAPLGGGSIHPGGGTFANAGRGVILARMKDYELIAQQVSGLAEQIDA